MLDIGTEYIGLKLKNPIIASSSPLSKHIDQAKQLEDAGAAALIMHSLFEEELLAEQLNMDRFLAHQSLGHAEANSFFPEPADYTSSLDQYLENLLALKKSLQIPVVASLNGVSLSGWVEHGKELQQAGADALELNIYSIPTQVDQDCVMIEQQYVDLLGALISSVSLPVTVKISAQFSAPVHMVKKLEQAGAKGVVVFNRFYQPDIDLETLEVIPKLQLSTSSESLLRIRWIAILFSKVKLSLAVTGGMHTGEDILKALLAGADVTYMCSALLKHGPSRITQILQEINTWMQEHEYESVRQLKGSVSHKHAIDSSAYERANYIKVLDSYSSSRGVRR